MWTRVPQKEIEERTEFDLDTRSQEKHDEFTDSTSTGRTRIGGSKKEEHKKIRVPGLLHVVVKKAEHLRVQELVQVRKSSFSRSTSCQIAAEQTPNDSNQQNSKETQVRRTKRVPYGLSTYAGEQAPFQKTPMTWRSCIFEFRVGKT